MRVSASEGRHERLKLRDGLPEASVLVPGPLEPGEAEDGVGQEQNDLPAVPSPTLIFELVILFEIHYVTLLLRHLNIIDIRLE